MFRDYYVSPANPGTGFNLDFQLSAGQRVQLLAMSLLLTTDATAGDRRLALLIRRGSTDFHLVQAQTVQSPSTAVRYYIGPGNADDTAVISLRVRCRLPYPLEMWGSSTADQGWRIDSDVANLAAGDALTAINCHFRIAASG